ncbi:MAG: hypothetical protein R6X35_07290, partial [Candidatus Krumholzibacteriia bacterium]
MSSRIRLAGRLFVTVGLMVATGLAGVVTAQTPPAACGSDSLYLRSPAAEGISVRLSPGTRLGSIITWPVPDPAVSTCAVVQGSGLDFGVDVAGSYLDNVDRELLFTSADRGQIGGEDISRLLLTWSNRHVGRTGRLSGAMNLSNSGGLLRYESVPGTWARLNAGLPNYLTYTNVMSLTQSPHQPGRLLAGLDASSPGSTLGLRPRGLWEKPGPDDPWRPLLPAIFGGADPVRALAYSPHLDGTFAAGTEKQGLYIVRDHGASWQLYARNLDPNSLPPQAFTVDALTWAADGRLFVGIRAFGLFVTEDVGGSWCRLNIRVPQNPSLPQGFQIYPRLQQLIVDPADPAHLLVALRDYGIYRSQDAGTTWEPLYGDWFDPTTGTRNGVSVAVT